MSDPRPSIPAELARRVRQRCGFACVMCGSPFVTIEHIEEWSKVKTHDYENLALLCFTCNVQRKGIFFSKQDIIEERKKTETRSASSPEKIFPADFEFDIGGNIVKAFRAFDILGFGFIQLHYLDRMPVLNARIRNDKGEPSVEITDNIYTSYNNVWDIQTKGKTITVRRGANRIIAQLTIDQESRRVTLRGTIPIKKGVTLRIVDDGIFVNRILLIRSCLIHQSGSAILVKEYDFPENEACVVRCSNLSHITYQGRGIGFLNSWNCRNSLIQWCHNAFVWTPSFLEQLTKSQAPTKKKATTHRATG